jgi:protein-S-isoprenylcysteine O-methyltransferase Ste14
MIIIKWVMFIAATAGIVYVSRASLLAPRSHGFYRFFAWEIILVQALLNLDHWFRDPFSWYQLISWPLLVISAFVLILGVRLLRQRGKPNPQRDDAPLVGLEKTTELVTTGVYRYIRHPLYSSLLFLAWGIFFKRPSRLGGLLALAATLLLVATARIEEAENIRYFGPSYEDYRQRSRMFIPFLF